MAAIFDLDGTLLMKGVQPNSRVVDLINRTPDAYIVTGRSESERAKTTQVLKAHGIRYSALLMNSGPNNEEGQLHSKRLHAQSILRNGPVSMAIDDNPTARLLYKHLGISKVLAP